MKESKKEKRKKKEHKKGLFYNQLELIYSIETS